MNLTVSNRSWTSASEYDGDSHSSTIFLANNSADLHLLHETEIEQRIKSAAHEKGREIEAHGDAVTY